VVSARTAFLCTAAIGTLWAVYGLFTSNLNIGIGAVIAAVGVIGADYVGWREETRDR
jgi:hypothetical protein